MPEVEVGGRSTCGGGGTGLCLRSRSGEAPAGRPVLQLDLDVGEVTAGAVGWRTGTAAFGLLEDGEGGMAAAEGEACGGRKRGPWLPRGGGAPGSGGEAHGPAPVTASLMAVHGEGGD